MSDLATRIGSLVDANLHLWDQASNPVFWLSDRTLLVGMLGDYRSLPDRYALADHLRTAEPFELSGVVWSDAGAADPVRAIEWVRGQDTEGLLAGIVTLGDPLAPGFADFVALVAEDPLVSSIRVRLTPALQGDEGTGPGTGAGQALLEGFRLLGGAGLVATIEASADQLSQVEAVADQLPELRIVLDHFGWPDDLTPEGRARHLERLRGIAAHANVATRLDALGTIFGAWDVETVRPWLEGAVDIFGAERCMVGTDMPIETLRTSFADLYGTYDEIFRLREPSERRRLFHDSALAWLAAR